MEGHDRYCGKCGAAQPGAAGGPAPRSGRSPFSDITPRTASILCYVPGIGWVASILVLAAERFKTNRTVRFHAFQGLYLFVAWLLNDWVLSWVLRPVRFGLHGAIQLLLLGASIFMMVKASHEEQYSLPILGELAERSVAED